MTEKVSVMLDCRHGNAERLVRAIRSQNKRVIVTPVYLEQGGWVRHAGRVLLTAFCTDGGGAGLLTPLRPAFSAPATTK